MEARRGFPTQDGLTRAADWQPAAVLRPKMGLQELRAGGFKPKMTLHELLAGSPPGGLRPNMRVQELRAGSPQGF